MAVADVVAACRARVQSVQKRDEAIKALVAQYRSEGLTYVAAVERVVDEVQAALRADGWTDEEIRGSGMSYGNVRVICERR